MSKSKSFALLFGTEIECEELRASSDTGYSSDC